MKRYFAVFAVLAIIFTLFSLPPVVAGGGTENAVVMYVDSSSALVFGEARYIDDDNRAVMPVVEHSRTLVPVRFVAESFGMTVTYDDAAAKVGIKNDQYNINFTIGSNMITVGGSSRQIDAGNPEVVAKVENGRTLIPLRSLAETIGKQVFYDRGLIVISDRAETLNPVSDKAELDRLIAQVNVLPAVGTVEYMEKLVASQKDTNILYFRKEMALTGAVPVPTAAAQNDKAKADYSETNVQVQGVDEADIVKTDGDYLYQVSGERIVITKINPASEMKIVSTIERAGGQFFPIEFFVDGGRLTVIANVHKPSDPVVYDSAKSSLIAPRYSGNVFTQVTVYNIADRSKPVLERTLELEGNYLSSRKIGGIVYLVANQYFYYYERIPAVPVTYTDNETGVNIGYDKVRYIPGSETSNYLIIASIDTDKPKQAAKVETLLGGGQNIYVSQDHLYVASPVYKSGFAETAVYKFSLTDGQITYLKKGSVNGNILNQFSMDEYNGSLRIATTSYDKQESNNLYVLDDTMTLSGSIEGIAPNERIYSARFVGDRGYMVTFRQVDPLFVIDLSDPKAPKILGNLKIPGYSDYIHPVDENHILGFGKDATDKGFYQGMKMALFDVTDVENPKQKFSEIIGDRGTESPLLQNHKALLYLPDKALLAFPVTVREVPKDDTTQTAYGQLTFSGAYVYRFNTQDGFSLKGKISHLSKEDMLKLGNYVGTGKEIKRILYASGNLITASDEKVQAHSAMDITLTGSVDIPTK